MSRHIPRVYLPEPLATGSERRIEGDSAHHLLRVLRCKPGAALILFNGKGGEYSARITQIERHSLQVLVEAHDCVERESALQITLLQAVARGEHMDFSIGKAVELGVNCIQPLMLARSQGMDAKRLARKQAHWQGIIRSAAEQSGRTRLPRLEAACSFEDWLVSAATHDYRLLLHPGPALKMASLPRPAAVAVLIGPEGGLSDDEVHQAESSGFTRLGLGPRILRTETAAITALTLVQACWGDLPSLL